MSDKLTLNDGSIVSNPRTVCTSTHPFGVVSLSPEGLPGKPMFFRLQNEAKRYGQSTHEHFALLRRIQ